MAPGRRLPAYLHWPRQPMARSLSFAALAAAGAYVLSVSISSIENANLASVALFAIAIAGLSMLTGGTGQLSLGHGALMAVGAYTYAELELHQPHLPIAVGLVAAAAMTALAGAIVGVAAARLRGPYLAGVTLAMGLALPQLADRYFNGDQGVPVQLTPPGSIEANHWLAWVCILAALATLVLLSNLRRSRFHRSFTAVRDDEIAASLAGISVARTQILAFVLSAACAGVAGALLAVADLGATSGLFPLTLSIQLIAGMVIGGMGSLVGAVYGAALIVYIPIWLTDLVNSPTSSLAANLPLLVFGALIIAVVLLAPGGVQGAVRRGAGLAMRRWRAARGVDEVTSAPAPASEGAANV